MNEDTKEHRPQTEHKDCGHRGEFFSYRKINKDGDFVNKIRICEKDLLFV